MHKTKWLEVEMNLQGTPNQVSRTVTMPQDFTIYYLHIIVATMFDFDDLVDVKVTYPQGEVFIGESGDNTVDEMFTALGDFLTPEGTQTFIYTYYGHDDWIVELKIAAARATYQHLTCIEATGTAIIFPQMTHEIYETLYTLPKETVEEFQKMKRIMGNDAAILEIDLNAADIKALNKMLHLLERNLIDDEENEIDVFEERESRRQAAEFDMNNIDFDSNAFFMYLYHDIAGLTEEQAAYEILYRTNVNEIIDIMLDAGYDPDTIDDMLSMNTPFDEKIYEQISPALDLLAILPQREELFSDEEEQLLGEIEEVILKYIDKVEAEGLLTDDDIETNVDEETTNAIIAEITAIRNRKLS